MKILITLIVSFYTLASFAKDAECHIQLVYPGTGETSQDLGTKSVELTPQGVEIFTHNKMTYKAHYHFSPEERKNLFSITASEFGMFLEHTAQTDDKNVRLSNLKNEVSLNCTLKN